MGLNFIEVVLIAGIISLTTSVLIALVVGTFLYSHLSKKIEGAQTKTITKHEPTTETEIPTLADLSTIENKKNDPSQQPKKESEEEQDEAHIMTGSDLSHHVPQIARFKDLDIPSIADQIQDESSNMNSSTVANTEEPTDESPIEEETTPEEQEEKDTKNPSTNPFDDQDTFFNTVPEAAEENDDDATVLVQRAPPK